MSRVVFYKLKIENKKLMYREADYLPFINGRPNLIDSVGFRIVPEGKNEEIPLPPTVPQAEYGPEVYVLNFVPPLKKEDGLKTYRNPNFVIEHHETEPPITNPGKVRDPDLITLKGQSFTCHHR